MSSLSEHFKAEGKTEGRTLASLETRLLKVPAATESTVRSMMDLTEPSLPIA